MTLIYLGCAWVTGILLGARFNPHPALILVGLAPLLLLTRVRQHRKTVVVASLCLFAVFGGALYFQSTQPSINENHLAFYNDQGEVALKGVVSDRPESGDRTTHLRLSASAINFDGDWHAVSVAVLLFIPRYPSYSYGDELMVTGELEAPSQLDDFDYSGYLAHQGVYATMLYPRVELVDKGQGSRPLAWLYSVRDRMSQTLAQVLPEPQASLAQGITLGIQDNIPETVRERFSHTGTAHLL
ncbi:MAG: ComEC/Rec2 family competence protein, partial [Dehalococcoidia bacterium]